MNRDSVRWWIITLSYSITLVVMMAIIITMCPLNDNKLQGDDWEWKIKTDRRAIISSFLVPSASLGLFVMVFGNITSQRITNVPVANLHTMFHMLTPWVFNCLSLLIRCLIPFNSIDMENFYVPQKVPYTADQALELAYSGKKCVQWNKRGNIENNVRVDWCLAQTFVGVKH